MNIKMDTLTVRLSREFVEKIVFTMGKIDDDLDWHDIYTACLESLSRENNGR